MKKLLLALAVVSLCLGSARAQFGGSSSGLSFDRPMEKLFGDNSAFSGRLETVISAGGQTNVMPAKIFVLNGMTRMEMDLTESTGTPIPPQMKAMGLAKVTVVTRPDKQLAYLIYPDLKAYAQSAVHDPTATNALAAYKLETTEAGKETVDGHPCVKYNAVVTDTKGTKHDFIVWNATDMKNFPIKIESTAQGQKADLYYRDVKLVKPDSSLFEPPNGFSPYDTVQDLIQDQMMKRMGPGASPAPGP